MPMPMLWMAGTHLSKRVAQRDGDPSCSSAFFCAFASFSSRFRSCAAAARCLFCAASIAFCCFRSASALLGQAGLKNHGAGNPWGRVPSMMLSEINGFKLMTFEPFCSAEKCNNSISTKMSILEPSCSSFTTCWCSSAFCSSRTYWSAVLPQLSLLAETL